MEETFKFKAKLLKWEGKVSWFLVRLPVGIAQDINHLFAHAKKGFGSLPVEVESGGEVWKTSIFPDKEANTYILFVKIEIRKKLNIKVGDVMDIKLKLKDK